MTIADLDYHEYFTSEALEKLRAAFRNVDLDDGGSITADELFAAFRKLGRNLSKQQVRELAKTVDQDESGEIEFEEFCLLEIMLSGMRPHVCLINYRDYLPDAQVHVLERRFVTEDPSETGAIGIGIAAKACEDLSEGRASREDLQELMKQADVDNGGLVDFKNMCAAYVVATNCRRKCNYREFLNADQVAKFRKVFTNGAGPNGTCSFADLEKLLRRLGMHVKKQQLQWLIQNFDADGSGDIDFEEFCIMLLRLKGLKKQSVINPQTRDCEDLFRNEGFTVLELQNSGFSLKHFKDARMPVAKLISDGGLSTLDLRRAGYTPQELRRGGVGASTLRRSGYSLADLRVAGFSGLVLQDADRELKGSMSSGDLSLLAAQRPLSSSKTSAAPVRGAVLSTAGAAALQPAAPCPWQLPPRPMTQMIREHTDWQPRLPRHIATSGVGLFPADWKPTLGAV